MSSRRTILLPVLLLLPLLLSCSLGGDDSAAPEGRAESDYDVQVTPRTGDFVLSRVRGTLPDGQPVWIDLVGRNLQVDEAAERVSLEVALRNRGEWSLYPPALLTLRGFRPVGVVPLNADATLPPGESDLEIATAWIYDYSLFLGPDGLLEPGGLSGFRPWTFLDPDLVAFAFEARASFGLEPDGPHIAGRIFVDEDRDGRSDPTEPPGMGGTVEVLGPDGDHTIWVVAENGEYRVPVAEPGLYRLLWVSPPTFAPVCLTTPNPLEVLLPPVPSGEPRSLDHADFGIDPLPCGAFPVLFWEGDPDELRRDPYQLLSLGLDGGFLEITAGFGGCQPEHPFTLFLSREVVGDDPPEIWAVLAHDGLGEDCEALWQRELRFQLDLVRVLFEEMPPVLRVRFLDHEGQARLLLWEP